MRGVRCISFFAVWLVLAGFLPLVAPTSVQAQADLQAASWYRYQGEPSSYDTHNNQNVNCGPSSVAMAIQYGQNVSVPIKDIRAFMHHGGATNHKDITGALQHWGVQYRSNIVNATSLRDVVARGNIAIAAVNMDRISQGTDIDGASTDPALRTGRFDNFSGAHWIVIKGVSPDGKYFVVYDGNVWGSPANSTYWYNDGTPKGLDRLYRVSEVEAGMFANAGRTASKGVEIISDIRPSVEEGEQHDAAITYYTAAKQETGKGPGDPGHGVMFNGNQVHWGAVAVDPRYIPLGTRMSIEGWGDQVFVAEDTGSRVRGWHVDVFWPGARQEALQKNDTMGGTRTVTLLGPGPAFTDRAPGTAPMQGTVSIVEEPDSASTRWVTLRLAARDAEDPVVGMMVSNNMHFTDAFEEPYAGRKKWTLAPGDGTKTVYARFKNEVGAWSDAVATRVTLEEQPPRGSVVVAPDPRVLLSAGLSGTPLAAIGAQPTVTGQPAYRPLGPNLLRNASFEAWAGGLPEAWETGLREEGPSVYEPATAAHHGALALRRVTGTGKPEADLGQGVVIKPGTQYSLSAWVRGAGGALAISEFATQAGRSRSLKTRKLNFVGGDSWQRVRLKFTTGSNATDARVRLSGGQVLWDAVQLEQGRTPGAYRADGLLLERPAQNLLANSSLEVNADRWNGLNSYVSVVASTDYSRYGRHGLLVRKLQSGRAATFQAAKLKPGTAYTYSVYVRLRDGKEITNDILRGWYYEGTRRPQGVDTALIGERNRPTMRWTAAGGGWYRGRFTFEATTRVGLYGLLSTEAIRADNVYYLDGAQLEAGRHTSSYLDGSLGKGYSWAGKPFASVSARSRTTVEYDTTIGREGALLFWARPEATAPHNATLMRLGNLRLAVNGRKLDLREGGKTLASAAWKPGAAQSYAVLWKEETVSLWLNGTRVGASRIEPSVTGAALTLGPAGGWRYPNAVIGDVSLWRTSLTAPELAHSPLDAGLHSVRDQYTTVVTRAADETGGDIRVEWSVDGSTWYSWERGRGIHNWDLGSGEGVKTVWIRYTDAADNWLVYTDTVIRDTTPPRVTSAEVARNVVTVRFSEPVAVDSLANAALISRGRRVAGVWDYTLGNRKATLKLPSPPPRQLELRVSRGLHDRSGNSLTAPYSETLRSAP
ncbi:MAG: carbohydrate binding domain-containing protein [Chloroflexia bacterium]|nr:carbohydrate binding domain-containing protein [Chloroflexia bacterium]